MKIKTMFLKRFQNKLLGQLYELDITEENEFQKKNYLKCVIIIKKNDR